MPIVRTVSLSVNFDHLSLNAPGMVRWVSRWVEGKREGAVGKEQKSF
jgi:hypothetical protein